MFDSYSFIAGKKLNDEDKISFWDLSTKLKTRCIYLKLAKLAFTLLIKHSKPN